MMIKKQLIAAVAAVFLLAGCGASAAADATATTATGHSTFPATAVAANNTLTPGNTDGAPAGALPFPVGKGYTWKYRVTGSSGLSTTTETTTKITSVQSTAAGLRVTEYFSTSADSKLDGSAVWIFHPNGTITYPLTEGLGGVQITHSSGGVLFPTAAEIASGRAYHSTFTITVVADGRTSNETAHITVQGAGTQTVTVPAGTYRNATVLKMVMDLIVDKIPFDLTFKYWIAKGTGEVKWEELSGSSTPNETSVLLSFTR